MSAKIDSSWLHLDPVVPTEVLLLLLLVGCLIFIWDLFERKSRNLKTEHGLQPKSELVALRGSSALPSKDYHSVKLGLSGRPAGLLREEGELIPVEIFPLSKKVKDRHVIQLVADLRLIEEIEGKRPPYGLLIMGEEAKAIRIKNTEEKQEWLARLLQEMREIESGSPAQATPSYYKCRSCDVNELCSFTAYKNDRTEANASADEDEGTSSPD